MITLRFFYLCNNGRTKVECAGLCLSIEDCHAFNWISSADFNLAGDNMCRLLEIDEICLTTDYDPIEIYADANIVIPSCAGKKFLYLILFSYIEFLKHYEAMN